MKQLILGKSLISDVMIDSMLERPWHYGLMLISFNHDNCRFDASIYLTMGVMKISDCKKTTHFPIEGQDYYFDFFPTDMELVKYTDIPFIYPELNYN